MDGNVFLKGAKPSKHERQPVVKPDFDPGLRLVEKADGFYLEIVFDGASARRKRQLVTTALLGQAVIPGLPYEQADGSPIRIDRDYFGKTRDASAPTPGPFEARGPAVSSSSSARE